MLLHINKETEETDLTSDEIADIETYSVKLAKAFFDRAYLSDQLYQVFDRCYAEVSFVSETQIRELNRDNRDNDNVTDVLSFPQLFMTDGDFDDELSDEEYETDEAGNKVICLGDVILCVPRIRQQASEYGHSFIREAVFLIAHSVLHLIGYDHDIPTRERVMISDQKKLMNAVGLTRADEEDEEGPDNIAYPAGSFCDHCGYVSILGRPNVGKSTLLNYISGMKVAIVSHKPQTTRTNIRSIYNTDDTQIIFTDTPGVHRSGNKLGKIMVSNSFTSARNSDVILLMADGRFNEPGDVEKELIKMIKKEGLRAVLAINKSDDIEKETLLPAIKAYSELYDFEHIIPISARTGDNVDVLLDTLGSMLPLGPRLYDSEYMTDQTEREIAGELIREQLLHYMNQEIPHGTAVSIDCFEEKYKEDPGDEYDRQIVKITASVICERESHKAMIIGKGGQMLKRIGTASRRNIERMLGCKVYLELFVKVRKEWKDNDLYLKDLGYEAEDKDGDLNGF